MYWLSRGSRRYNQFIKYPRSVRYCCTILIFFVMVASWYTIIYRPIKNIINTHECANNALKKNSCQLAQDLSNIEKLSTAIASLEKDIIGYKSMSQDYNAFITNLVEQAVNNHVHLDSCKAEVCIDNGWYKTLPVNVSLTGSIEQIAAYTHSLYQADKLCFFHQINLVCSEENIVQCQVLVNHINIQ
jgi:Tfp pilus assembly protein PilO